MGQVEIRKYFFIPMLIFLALSIIRVHSQDGIDMDQFNAEEELRFGVHAYHEGAYNKALLSFERSLTFKPEFQLAEEWLART